MAVTALPGIQARHAIVGVDVHLWELESEYAISDAPLELIRSTLEEILLAQGYLPVDKPAHINRTLEPSARLQVARALDEDGDLYHT